MLRLLKRSALGVLTSAGYKLLTQTEYERLQVTAAASPVAALPSAPMPPPPARDALSALLAAGTAETPAASTHDAIRDFLDASGAVSEFPALRRLALYSTARYLCESAIGGAVMDCGHGQAETLTVLALAFQHIGDASRQLVLFDTTADPTHRPEFEFALWGGGRDLIAGRQVGSPAPISSEPLPVELVATGYPAANVSIRRYPREEIAGCGPLAFLGLTSQTYPANQEAIATYFPLLSRGGVIAVEGPLGSGAADAVDHYLRREGIALLLIQVAPDFRLGIKP